MPLINPACISQLHPELTFLLLYPPIVTHISPMNAPTKPLQPALILYAKVVPPLKKLFFLNEPDHILSLQEDFPFRATQPTL